MNGAEQNAGEDEHLARLSPHQHEHIRMLAHSPSRSPTNSPPAAVERCEQATERLSVRSCSVTTGRPDSVGGTPPAAGHTDLYHAAFLYPDRRELAAAVRRLLDHGRPVDHGTDHGASVSVYLADPDGNGIELYHDRPARVVRRRRSPDPQG